MSDQYPAVPVGSALTEDALRRALDAAPDGVIVSDADGTMVFVNQMAAAMFEYRPDELLGTSVDQLLGGQTRSAHDALRAAYFENPRTRAMGSILDLRGRKHSGSEFPVEISLSPLQGRGRVLVIATVRDVTDRREAEQAFERVRAELALVDERERIARDLHDIVIQRLFAVGLSLQGALTRLPPGPGADRIEQCIDDIDQTIRDIRSTIFAFHSRRPGVGTLRDEVFAIALEATRALGFAPTLAFDGPVDSAATENMGKQVLSTLRESLSNVARHARATKVNVEIAVEGSSLFLRVNDDGVGVHPSASAGSGLTNMRARAEALAGGCEVVSPSAGGTSLVWWIPVGDV